MKVAYVDSSCIVALAFNERHAATLRARMRRFDVLVSSSLLEAEVACALKREERPITDMQWSSIRLIHPDRSLTSEISRVLGAGYVRGADCWHLATALYVAGEPRRVSFLTFDEAQGKVARTLGFRD